MPVLVVAFRFIVLRSWNCNWRKENAAASIFGCDYCTAESTFSWCKASLINFDFEFPGADSVYRISCLIFVQAWVGIRSLLVVGYNFRFGGLNGATTLHGFCFRYSTPWSYVLGASPVQSS